MQKFLLFVLISLLACAAACTKKSEVTSSSAGAPASLNKVVNLAIWSNYLSPELIADFEKRMGVKVQVSNYSSNEELLAKLQAGASGYDVVVPSDYMIFAMQKLGLLQALDPSKLPNAKSLDPRHLKRNYDPENKYSLPYDWGTTGIAVNRTLYPGEIKGWKSLFSNSALAGKFSLLDDVRETMGVALKALGYSLNTKDPAQIAQAKEFLIKHRASVKAFTSETLAMLVNGETAVSHAYVQDALQARKQTGGKIQYLIPEEGCTLWLDNLAIPTGAKNVAEAHALINYLLEAKSGASTALAIFAAPVNKESVALLPKELQADTSLFPTDAMLAKCEMIQDLGESLTLWDRAWTEVKAH